MLDRDFAIALVARCQGIAGLLENTLFLLPGSGGAERRPAGWTRAVGHSINAVYDAVLDPTFCEHPDLEAKVMQQAVDRQPRRAWDRFDAAESLSEPIPAAASVLDRDLALRMLMVVETIDWHLGFLVHDAARDRVPELPAARAAQRTQVWVVTHSQVLADALAEHGGVVPRTVLKQKGETWIEGLTKLGTFREVEEDD